MALALRHTMELMSESVGILLVLPVSDLGNAAVQRNAEKLCVCFCTSAADWRWSLVCFHNHCLFYVSVGFLAELIHCTVSLHMALYASSAVFSNVLSLVYVFN